MDCFWYFASVKMHCKISLVTATIQSLSLEPSLSSNPKCNSLHFFWSLLFHRSKISLSRHPSFSLPPPYFSCTFFVYSSISDIKFNAFGSPLQYSLSLFNFDNPHNLIFKEGPKHFSVPQLVLDHFPRLLVLDKVSGLYLSIISLCLDSLNIDF